MRKTRLYCAGAALLLAGCMLCGCGEASSTAETAPVSSAAESEAEVTYPDMKQLAADMAAADSTLPDMLTVTDADSDADVSFASVSDMEYDKIAHYLLVYSSAGKADEICVIAVKDKADAAEAEAELKKHAESRVRMYREYDATQVPRAEKAVVFSEGHYAVLIICDNADAVKAAFTAGIA